MFRKAAEWSKWFLTLSLKFDVVAGVCTCSQLVH